MLRAPRRPPMPGRCIATDRSGQGTARPRGADRDTSPTTGRDSGYRGDRPRRVAHGRANDGRFCNRWNARPLPTASQCAKTMACRPTEGEDIHGSTETSWIDLPWPHASWFRFGDGTLNPEPYQGGQDNPSCPGTWPARRQPTRTRAMWALRAHDRHRARNRGCRAARGRSVGHRQSRPMRRRHQGCARYDTRRWHTGRTAARETRTARGASSRRRE